MLLWISLSWWFGRCLCPVIYDVGGHFFSVDRGSIIQPGELRQVAVHRGCINSGSSLFLSRFLQQEWLMIEDVAKSASLRKAARITQVAESAPAAPDVDAGAEGVDSPSEVDDNCADALESTPRVADSDPPVVSIHNGREPDNVPDSMADAFNYIMSDRKSARPMITVKFSHDLSTISELNDPLDYFKEVEAIHRIEEEAMLRIEAVKAQAIKQARDLDDATYDERTTDLLISRTSDHTSSTPASPEKEAEASMLAAAEPCVQDSSIAIAQAQIADAPNVEEPSAENQAPQPSHKNIPLDDGSGPVDANDGETAAWQTGRSRILRVASRMKESGKTVARNVARLFCGSHSLS
ncbi:hypothetical protein C8R47DRAFT_1131367 [Mycena vitilis]|nr:hypothetical protein C8R47DRAFT_1131367 [Mycena vitilis]